MGLTYDVGRLSAACGLAPSDTEARALWATATDARFPGTLLPTRLSSDLVIYAMADTAVEWRRLQALLVAFAGPTLTAFGGVPDVLDATHPFEAIVLERPPHAAARLRPGPTGQLETWTLAALRRLQTRLADAPDLSIARPEPTSRLLAQMRDALNVCDFPDAWRMHATLRRELRLDALNLLQLEMLILSESGRWSEIRHHDRFDVLCHSEPPSATAAVLLTAFARVDLDDLAADSPEISDAWNAVASLALPLLRRVKSDSVEILRLRALAGLADARPEQRPPEAEPATSTTGNDSVQHAAAALLEASTLSEDGDTEIEDEARRAVEALPPHARSELLGRPQLRGVWSEIKSRSGNAPAPKSWADWVRTLGDSTVPAMEQARRGQEAWILPDADADPADAAILAHALLSVPDGLAGERFCEALPYFTKWAQNDPRWPRASYAVVYIAAITRTAFGSRRGEHALRSVAVLLEGALACGLDANEYRDTLDAVREIARVSLSARSVYAALDLIDVTRLTTSIDDEALERFAQAMLGDIDRLHGSLSAGQRLAATETGFRFGWTRTAAKPADSDVDAFRPIRALAVGVYTLTEAVGRHAKELLEVAAPGVKVVLSHDHVGTAPLAAMARNVDLFIIVAASAKHAATDFIRAKRGGRPLLFAAGRGASSVIRAVESFVETMP